MFGSIKDGYDATREFAATQGVELPGGGGEEAEAESSSTSGTPKASASAVGTQLAGLDPEDEPLSHRAKRLKMVEREPTCTNPTALMCTTPVCSESSLSASP